MKHRLIEIAVFVPLAVILAIALAGEFSESTPLSAYVIENGESETGAANLVTSIYLGFRAFDTFGETIVLLLAVSGVVLLVRHNGHDDGGHQ